MCCKDHSASESAGEDKPALDGPLSRGTRPVFVHLQPLESFGPKTTRPSRSWELESGRWPVRLVPVLCPWEPTNPGLPGSPRHKEIDPFQAVDNLTARDIQWRTTIRVASLGLEDMQQFLRISLESLGNSSKVGHSAPTRGRASQTRLRAYKMGRGLRWRRG